MPSPARPAGWGRAWPGAAAAWIRRQGETEARERRLFLWLPVAFGAGALLQLTAEREPWAPAPATALVVGGAAAWAMRQRSVLGFRLLLALVAILAGFTAACGRVARVAAPVLDRPRVLVLSAFVESVEDRRTGGRLVLRPVMADGIEAAALPWRIRVTTTSHPHVVAGDAVRVRARLVPPPEPSRPGGYDFAREAWFAGIGAVGSLTGAPELVPVDLDPGWRLRLAASIDRARNTLTRRIADAIGGPAGAVAASLVTGKRGLIPETANDDLRAAGIYHVVSISGLHMVLAAGMVFWIVRALLALVPGLVLRQPVKKWAAAVAILAAVAYNAFAGSEIATERSLVMTLVLLGAILADRPALSMRNLALAALAVLALEPESLTGPSFQMSFGAVAALIAVFERPGRPSPEPESLGAFGLVQPSERPLPAGPVLRLLRAGARHVGLALLTTLVAETATAPFALYHFQRISPYGLVGNALTLPLVSVVVMPAAVIGVLAMPFGWDGPVWVIMGWGVEAMLRVSAMVASWPGATRVVPAFGPGALLLLSAAILVATLCRSALRWAAIPMAAIGIVTAARAVPPDMVVSADGRAVMARQADGHLAVVGRRPSSFTLEQWLRADGDARALDDRSLVTGPRCDGLGCVARLPDGRALSLVLRPDAFEEDCRRAAIIVTPLRAPPFCRPANLVDRVLQERTGAVALVPRVPTGDERNRTVEWDLVPARAPGAGRPWMPRHSDQAKTMSRLPIAGLDLQPKAAQNVERPDPDPVETSPEEAADRLE